MTYKKRLLAGLFSALIFCSGCSNQKPAEQDTADANTDNAVVEQTPAKSEEPKTNPNTIPADQIPLEMQKNNNNRLPFEIHNGWIYGAIHSDGSSVTFPLAKRRLEENEWTYINGQEPCYIRVKDEYLYVGFAENDKCALYKMNLSGDNVKKITNLDARGLQICGDTLYIAADDADYKYQYLYSCDLEGENLKKVFDKPVYYPFTPDGNIIYYQDDADGETIHKCDLAAGTDERISSEYAYAPIFDGKDTLYYIHNSQSTRNGVDDGDLVARTISTGEEKVLYSGVSTAGLQYAQGTLYFSNLNDGDRLYSISTTGENISLIADDTGVHIFNVSEDKLFFTSQDESGGVLGVYCTNLDGSNKILIE